MSADIIARLEKATGPDRELDALIALATGAMNVIGEWRYRPGDGKARKLEPFTASLDAALALVGEKLGGKIGPIELSIAGSAQCGIMSNDPCGWHVQALGNTAPLAVLLALFRALETA